MWEKMDLLDETEDQKKVVIAFGDGDKWTVGEQRIDPDKERKPRDVVNDYEVQRLAEESEVKRSGDFKVSLYFKREVIKAVEELMLEENGMAEELTRTSQEGTAEEFEVKIKPGCELPKPQKMRRRSKTEETQIEKWVAMMLKQGFIERAYDVEHAA